VSRPVVTLYVTGDCHLCEEAEQLLRRLARQMRFRLELVDIASDAALYERYCLAAPVLAVDGEAVLSAPLDEQRVKEALAQRR
jgi:predicted DCC family thiol-disulfide oxidoreductase YuxK